MRAIGDFLPDSKEITFEDFYWPYPKKANKPKAKALWDKLPLKKRYLAIVDVHDRKERHAQWREKQFVPNPDVYLRNEKWNDDIVEVKTKAEKLEEAEDGTIYSRLWTMLTEIYGDKLTRSYGETMPKAWIYGMKDLTQKEASKILQYISTDQDERLPDLPKINRIRRIGRDYSNHISLPRPKVDESIVMSELDKMKKELGIK